MDYRFGPNFDPNADHNFKLNQKVRQIKLAIDYYLQGVLVDSYNFDLMYNLGCLYNHMNKLKTAMYYFSKAYLKKLMSVQTVYSMAVVLYRLGEYNESKGTFLITTMAALNYTPYFRVYYEVMSNEAPKSVYATQCSIFEGNVI